MRSFTPNWGPSSTAFPFEGLSLRQHTLSGRTLMRRGTAQRWPMEQQGNCSAVLRDQRVPGYVGIARTFSAPLPSYPLAIRHRSPRRCSDFNRNDGATARVGQSSARTGKQTSWRFVDHRNIQLGSAGALGGRFRREEPGPQPIASTISRSACVIQAAGITRQAALLDPN